MTDARYTVYIDKAYRNYEKNAVVGDVIDSHYEPARDKWNLYNKEEFINIIKKNNKFSEKWGLKIEERELSSQERKDLYDKTDYVKDIFPTDESGWNKLFDGYKIPTKLITITKITKIESYG
jgi:hypothetical protein